MNGRDSSSVNVTPRQRFKDALTFAGQLCLGWPKRKGELVNALMRSQGQWRKPDTKGNTSYESGTPEIPPPGQRRSKQVGLRLTNAQQALIDYAATLEGYQRSEWIRKTLIDTAQATIKHHKG